MQILLTSLIMGKIVLGSFFLYEVKFTPLFTETIAIASEPQKDSKEAAKPAKKAESDKRNGEEPIDLSLLKKKEAELKEREKYLENRKMQLVALQDEINKKIASLTRLRNEIKAEMEQEKTNDEKKLKHLIKIYSAMKPVNAASLIEKLNIRLAIKLLSKMKGDTVGGILSFVDVAKAAKISEGLLRK
ncbi:MAG: hypothetical protein JRJ86_23805 [Deltaproteobacteria bacterium]|nr:hypothetical protein [Deltaproteobacteria bacterium]